MAIDLSAANQLPPRADEFFRIFARFEFALKMAGFGAMRGERVEINWNQFANSNHIGKPFFSYVKEENLCPIIIANPPKAELIEDGQYGFKEEISAINSVQELFGAVRRVRNNLFHGGKYFDEDDERNRILLAESITVLLCAAQCHSEVKFFFEGLA